MMVVDQHAAVAHAAVAHAGQAPDVAGGAVLDGDAVVPVRVVRERDQVEVLLRSLGGREMFHRHREMDIAGLDSRVGGAALDEKQKQKKPQVGEHHHRRRADVVPEPAGVEHPKEHPAPEEHHRHRHAHGLPLGNPEPAAKAIHVVHVVVVLHLVVSERSGAGGGEVGVGHKPVGDNPTPHAGRSAGGHRGVQRALASSSGHDTPGNRQWEQNNLG